jgi:hypothetical protein
MLCDGKEVGMGCLNKPALHLRPSILVVVTQSTTIGKNDRAGEGLRCVRVLRHHATIVTRERFTIACHNISILQAQLWESVRVLMKKAYLQLFIQKGL